MKHSVKGFCLLIFSIFLLINFLIYRNVSFDRKLAAFYGKQTWKSKGAKFWGELDTKLKKELDTRLAAAAKDKKIILFWTTAFGRKPPASSPDKEQCGYCDISYDRSLIHDNRTGAVLYHFDGVKASDMPTKRYPNQLHIFWAMEAPATLKIAKFTLETEEKYGMNATMIYRRDADFVSTYELGTILQSLMGQNSTIYHRIMKNKSKLAVSAISDCRATNGAVIRVALIKQLKESRLRIETFGSCFDNWIDRDTLQNSIRQYKFYFAYENSYHCRDYITEKFFMNALQHDAVPVVWGATKNDYEAIAPPGSFIHSEDFNSPDDLIEYLEFLDKNDTEYLKYFRWRTMRPEAAPLHNRKTELCAICRALHGINVDYRFNPKYDQSTIPLFTDGVAKRVVPSLQQYIFEDENPECFNVY